jgi:hypothetical protein
VWLQYRAWSRSTSGVLRRVIGAVQDGTAQGFANMVPHVAAQELRQDMQQVMATCGTIATAVVMVGDRSGIHRAHQLDAPLDHDQGQLRFHGFPAHGGHHRKPSEGFWRVRQDVSGAGRCLPELQQRYQCTRHVRMAHQERPMYAFHW